MFGFGKKKKETKKAKPAPKKAGIKTAARKPAVKKVAAKPQKLTVARKIAAPKKYNKRDTVPVTVKKHRDSNGNHNHVILGNVGNNHISVGLSTHDKKGKKGGNNYPLQKDTLDVGQKGYKPKDETYMRRQGTVDRQDQYFQERKGSMVKKDYKKAMEYGNRAKEKFLQKKSNGSAKRVNQSPLARGSKTTRPLLNRKITKLESNVKIKKVVRKKQR